MIYTKHCELFNKDFYLSAKVIYLVLKKLIPPSSSPAVGGAINDRGRRGGADWQAIVQAINPLRHAGRNQCRVDGNGSGPRWSGDG